MPYESFRDGVHPEEKFTSVWVHDLVTSVLKLAMPYRTFHGAVNYGFGYGEK